MNQTLRCTAPLCGRISCASKPGAWIKLEEWSEDIDYTAPGCELLYDGLMEEVLHRTVCDHDGRPNRIRGASWPRDPLIQRRKKVDSPIHENPFFGKP